jgi:hypothetical protein
MMRDAPANGVAPITRERLFGWHAAPFSAGYFGLKRIRMGVFGTMPRARCKWSPAPSVVSACISRHRRPSECLEAASPIWSSRPKPLYAVLEGNAAGSVGPRTMAFVFGLGHEDPFLVASGHLASLRSR